MTAVTQLTADRVDRLLSLSARWPGPMSVALYMCPEEGTDGRADGALHQTRVQASLRRVESAFQHHSLRSRADLHLVRCEVVRALRRWPLHRAGHAACASRQLASIRTPLGRMMRAVGTPPTSCATSRSSARVRKPCSSPTWTSCPLSPRTRSCATTGLPSRACCPTWGESLSSTARPHGLFWGPPCDIASAERSGGTRWLSWSLLSRHSTRRRRPPARRKSCCACVAAAAQPRCRPDPPLQVVGEGSVKPVHMHFKVCPSRGARVRPPSLMRLPPAGPWRHKLRGVVRGLSALPRQVRVLVRALYCGVPAPAAALRPEVHRYAPGVGLLPCGVCACEEVGSRALTLALDGQATATTRRPTCMSCRRRGTSSRCTPQHLSPTCTTKPRRGPSTTSLWHGKSESAPARGGGCPVFSAWSLPSPDHAARRRWWGFAEDVWESYGFSMPLPGACASGRRGTLPLAAGSRNRVPDRLCSPSPGITGWLLDWLGTVPCYLPFETRRPLGVR